MTHTCVQDLRLDAVGREDPASYPQRILLAVTGLSPQVVTETLYALAVQQEHRFVPTEVRLITTAEGAERARLSLLHEKTGWFHRLRADYVLPHIDFDPDHIHVLNDADDEGLPDIRDVADNIRVADAITRLVREFTCDPQCALHVSIAGGRKTMGFHLGYALSLFGRVQDRLSHVLVSAPYESHPQFFYPPPTSEIIYTAHSDSRPHDSKEAVVTLAELPFVRLREGLERESLDAGVSFSAMVAEAQRALPMVHLRLDPSECRIWAGGRSLQLAPSHFALYWLLAGRCQRGERGMHWSEPEFAPAYLRHYAELVSPASGDYERAERAYERGATKDNVDPAKAHIKRTLEQHLGRRNAEPYLIRALARIPGTRYRKVGLTLRPEQIEIVAPGKLAGPRGGEDGMSSSANPSNPTKNGRP